MPFKSDQSVWRELLQKYKTFKLLWHKNEKDSHTEDEHNNAWEELVEIAKNISEEADKDFVQKRIKSFLLVCHREKKKIKAAEAAGKRYQPKIYYYDILSSVLDEENTPENASPIEEKKSNETKNIIVKEEVDCDSTKEQLTDEPTTKRPRNGPAQILARRMAEHLEQMDADQALIAEKIISDICVYGRLKQLNIDSSIALK